MKLICTMCPNGCEMTAETSGGELVITGNECKRGLTYAKEEITSPKRNISTVLKTESGKIFSVKTVSPIDKERIFEAVAYLKSLKIKEVHFGEIIARDVCGSDIMVISY